MMRGTNPISTSHSPTASIVELKNRDTAILIATGLGLLGLAVAIYAIAVALGVDSETVELLTFHS